MIDSFYLFGGFWSDILQQVPRIARLDINNWSWSTAGQLNTPRSYHGVILANSKVLVVGGRVFISYAYIGKYFVLNYPLKGNVNRVEHPDNELNTEECERLENGRFTCTSTNENYKLEMVDTEYPILFLVSEKYRNCAKDSA